MASNIELRSTFQFTQKGLGILSLPNENSIHPTSALNSEEETDELVRKNSYGVASLMSKTIFSSFDDEMKAIAEPSSGKKLSSIINNHFARDGRTLSITHSKDSLEQFEFNSENPFDTGVGVKFFLKEGSHKGHVILHIPAFVPVKQLNIPEEATNFKISVKLISVSDFEKRGDGIRVVSSSQHGKVGAYETTMLPVLRIPTEPLTGQLSIRNIGTIGDSVSCVLVMAIKFYSYEKSKFRFMSEKGMMKFLRIN